MRKKERIRNMLRYDNRLNKVSFGSLNTLEQNLLFAIICGMYGKTELVFDLEALRRFASGSATPIRADRIEYLIDCMKDSIFNGYITERIGAEEINVHLFRAMNKIYDCNNKLIGLKVIIDELAKEIFARKAGNLTIADYDIFASIRSTYAKSIFRLLSQYKGTGIARFKYDEFLYFISCPDTYNRQENIKARILEPSVKVIGDYFKGLEYELIKGYKDCKKQITHIVFRFEPIEYKSDIGEGLKGLKLNGSIWRDIKEINNTINGIYSNISPSAEQTKIISELEKQKYKLLRDNGIYDKIEEIKENRFNCLNDVSKKLEGENNESL